MIDVLQFFILKAVFDFCATSIFDVFALVPGLGLSALALAVDPERWMESARNCETIRN